MLWTLQRRLHMREIVHVRHVDVMHDKIVVEFSDGVVAAYDTDFLVRFRGANIVETVSDLYQRKSDKPRPQHWGFNRRFTLLK
jgi:hypothetical protein